MKKSTICGIVSKVLIVVLIVLQFLPFWKTEEVSASVYKYVWLTHDLKDLTKYFEANVEGFSKDLNTVVLMPILVLVALFLSYSISRSKPGKCYAGLITLAAGLFGTFTYLTSAVYHLGSGWVLHLVVCILIVVVSAVEILFSLKKA